jgi:hypothetical protein
MRLRFHIQYSSFSGLLNLHPTLYLCNRNRDLLEKLTGSQLLVVKKFPAFSGSWFSLPHSKVFATCPYTESDQSSPWPQLHYLKICFMIILPSTPRLSKWSFSLRVSPQCNRPIEILQEAIRCNYDNLDMSFEIVYTRWASPVSWWSFSWFFSDFQEKC